MSSDIIGKKKEDWVNIDISLNTKEYTNLINIYVPNGNPVDTEKYFSEGETIFSARFVRRA